MVDPAGYVRVTQPQVTRITLPWKPALISPSINEGALGPVDDTDVTRVRTHEAMKGLRLAAEKARSACLAVHGNPDISEGARHVQAEAISFKLTNQSLPFVDKAREALEGQIAKLREVTKGPVTKTDIQSLMLQTELRNFMASMSGKARLDVIAKSLAEGDDSLAASALSASRFLTGLTALEVEHVRLQWAQRRVPDQLARLKALEADLQHLNCAGSLLIQWQRTCADRNIVQAAKARQAATAAAIQGSTG
jgi:hypothetical protein